GTTRAMILHLRTEPTQPWRAYTDCPEHAVPDYPISKGSQGWATYQKLLRQGWTLVPTTQAQAMAPVQQLQNA
ncbi:MAG TPA: hypothetical protein V6D03_13640, partial [Candidatus Caenarcaniphilales bacterium]